MPLGSDCHGPSPGKTVLLHLLKDTLRTSQELLLSPWQGCAHLGSLTRVMAVGKSQTRGSCMDQRLLAKAHLKLNRKPCDLPESEWRLSTCVNTTLFITHIPQIPSGTHALHIYTEIPYRHHRNTIHRHMYITNPHQHTYNIDTPNTPLQIHKHHTHPTDTLIPYKHQRYIPPQTHISTYINTTCIPHTQILTYHTDTHSI